VELLKYAFAVHARLPRQAREAFAEVLRRQPDDPQALYGQAMLLLERPDRDRPEEALLYLNRALQADPRHLDAQRFRGIVLARLGRFEDAKQDINWCLERDKSGPSCYAAACVSALLAEAWSREKAGGRAALERQAAVHQALAFLQQALAQGYGRDQAADDSDLKALRRDPEFQRMLRSP
jgi:predicted Zn-dependent protease